MAEYWKSTPTYWCKFCSQYIRDTTIAKKTHEASVKHQNNIQRSLRALHKGKEQEERKKQQARDEIARLNGMFSGAKKTSTSPLVATTTPTTQPPILSAAQQRKAHAEQLAALGVKLPEELQKEVTGVGNYHVVQECEIVDGCAVSVRRSLADILAEAKRQGEDACGETEDAKPERDLKRKLENDQDLGDEEAAPRHKKDWGSNFKTHPGKAEGTEDAGDLDALLSGVTKKEVTAEKERKVKSEVDSDVSKGLRAVPDIKQAEEATGPLAVVFKKRKGKK